jgi:hypothetical protein
MGLANEPGKSYKNTLRKEHHHLSLVGKISTEKYDSLFVQGFSNALDSPLRVLKAIQRILYARQFPLKSHLLPGRQAMY